LIDALDEVRQEVHHFIRVQPAARLRRGHPRRPTRRSTGSTCPLRTPRRPCLTFAGIGFLLHRVVLRVQYPPSPFGEARLLERLLGRLGGIELLEVVLDGRLPAL